MSARTRIVQAFVEKVKTIDGASPFRSALHGNVEGRQKFWDEVNDFPYVCINAGQESREYQADAFKWGYLMVNIKIYTKGEDCQMDLEDIMEDIEYVMEENHTCLVYGDSNKERTSDIRLLQVTTDEGVLHPIGVGELIFSVRYEVL